jgi:hypothetical protein
MRKKFPDIEKALSLIESAEADMKFTLGLKISKASANTIVRNVYESFRMLGEALLVANGDEQVDHLVCITALLKLDVDTSRPINLIEGLRKLRHNINYYGYRSDVVEAEDVISIAKCCFAPLLKKVRELVGSGK